MRYLLIGNPNVGKSSIFNLITNAYAHVANYGGITIDKKMGKFKYGEIIDLPGTYNIIPSSEDEGIVTYALLNETYDGIINVVDSTHLKRNLHLTIQLLERGFPVVLALNMIDELVESGKKVNYHKLSEKLKCQVFGVSAKTKAGIDELNESLQTVKKNEPLKIYYGEIIEKAIDKITSLVEGDDIVLKRFLAIQILEGNSDIFKYINVNHHEDIKDIYTECEKAIIDTKTAFSLKGAIFNRRREFINSICKDCLITVSDYNKTKVKNHKIDKYVMHPFWGSIIFLLVIFSVYFFTFDVLGSLLSDGIEYFMLEILSPFMEKTLLSLGAKEDGVLMSLVLEGVIAGVGGVLVFIPQIGILFFLLAVIESTGYMARVAINLDTLFSKFGLNGKAIIPLVTGIGCNVPAIMATRTIADKRERYLTILILPFMSCSARIPIYALMASLFFDKYKALIILSMYLIGTVVALVAAKLLSLSIFKNTANDFILEIPPYRLPRKENVIRQTSRMITDFIEKAGKFILLGTIVLWFLQYLGPSGIAKTNDSSFLAYLGNFFAPIFKPIGFGHWQASSSLIVGFLAKELIFSSMMVIYGSEAAVSLAFTGISAFSFMVFSLLYLPCLATIGTIHQETKSLKFTLLASLFTFSVAFIVSFIVYQLGLFFF